MGCGVGRLVTVGYWPKWAALTCLALGLLALIGLAGCRQGKPVVDVSPKPAAADGTISGTVRGPQGTSSIDGRAVEAVNLETGERQRVTTNRAGGFTFKVPPGKYRVEVALREGESVVKRPDVIDVNRSDVDAHADFVIGTPRTSTPRGYRANDGLGAPIA